MKDPESPLKTGNSGDHVVGSPVFEPVIQLPLVEVKTLEEDEDVLLKMRAKLYRYATEEEPHQWKERGIGYIKFLKHKNTGHVRLLMRREKTHKICCNHLLNDEMELTQHLNSDRAFVWTAAADFAEEEARHEVLAIKFANVSDASKFSRQFNDGKKLSGEKETDISSTFETLTVTDKADKKNNEPPTSNTNNAESQSSELKENIKRPTDLRVKENRDTSQNNVEKDQDKAV